MNKKIIYMSIGLLLLLITTMTFAYAYFNIVAENNSKENIVETGTLSIHYEDGPQIIMNDIYPGDSLEKTFKVTNTGTLKATYTISWESLTNTFLNDELVYTLMLNDEETTGVVPITDDNIKTGISIEPKEVHEYTLKITFIETGKLQNYNQGKGLSAKININNGHNSDVQIALKVNGQVVDELSEDSYHKLIKYSCDNNSQVSWDIDNKILLIRNNGTKENCTIDFEKVEKGSIFEKMLIDNSVYADNENSEFVNNTTPGINFSTISSNTNGKGLYYTSDLTRTEDFDGDGEGEVVYYYRGAVANNYIVFAGHCWKIVRTNEDGSVKLRYQGAATESADSYTCPTSATAIGTKFNSSNNNAKYVGYTYDTVNTDSTAKGIIDTWYANNIANIGETVTSLVVDTPYCNDRTVASTSGSTTYYGAYGRLETNKKPQYKCPNLEDDGYTLEGSSVGNGLLKYPIALLTADEVAYAGGLYTTANNSYYLYTGNAYFTMSPYYWSGSSVTEFHVNVYGNLHNRNVSDTYGLLPAVSLTATTTVSSTGAGTATNPYVVE